MAHKRADKIKHQTARIFIMAPPLTCALCKEDLRIMLMRAKMRRSHYTMLSMIGSMKKVKASGANVW